MSQQKLFLFGIVATLLIIGLGLSLFGGIRVASAMSTKSWPNVEGIITRSHVRSGIETQVRRSGPSKQTKQVVSIEYEYQVDDKTFSNDRVFACRLLPKGIDAANDLAALYSKGEAVDVFYNSKDPQRSVLDRSVGGSPLFSVIAGPLLFIAGLALIPFAVRYRSEYGTFAEQHAAMERQEAQAKQR